MHRDLIEEILRAIAVGAAGPMVTNVSLDAIVSMSPVARQYLADLLDGRAAYNSTEVALVANNL